MKSLDESNQFTFSAVLKDTLSLGIDVPFKGEETLIFDSNKPSGTIYLKTMRYLVSQKSPRLKPIEFKRFLQEVSKLFSNIDDIREHGCRENKCQFGTISSLGNGVEIKKDLDSKVNLHLSFEDYGSGYFKKVAISLLGRGLSDPLMKIDLRVKQCE